MTVNLKTTKFNDGTDIPNVTDMTNWVRITSPGFLWYNNDISNKEEYGGLYNWYTVNTGKLCAEVWKVPTDRDWETLITYLGGNDTSVEKLKNNDFSILLGGYRYGYYWGSGIFYEMKTNGYWWTSTECSDTHVWSRTINEENSRVYRSYFSKNNGFSVRCIKDK